MQQGDAVVLCSGVRLGGQCLVLAEGLQPFPLLLHLLVPVGLVGEEGVQGHSVHLTKVAGITAIVYFK